MNNKVIVCDNITHYYGNKLIYEDLCFEVERGKVLGLLGKNGTGKTTIINILNGFLKPHRGACYLFGEDVRKIRSQTKANIGLLLEQHIQYSFFNIYEIEKFYRGFYPRWKHEVYYDLMKKLKVGDKQPISRMSCGQRSQVALGLLFAQDPDLLILDDFSMGLDPGYRRLFVEYLRDWAKDRNKTIFLTSHIIQDMEYLIDDCMIMDYGRLLLHKPTKDILETFHRYTIEVSEQVQNKNLSIDEFKSIEQKGNKWIFYSFLSLENVRKKLYEQQITIINEIKSERLNLEDVFIGLTGKY